MAKALSVYSILLFRVLPVWKWDVIVPFPPNYSPIGFFLWASHIISQQHIALSQLKVTDSHENFDMSTANESVNLSEPQTKNLMVD